jgi:hypothetical protein
MSITANDILGAVQSVTKEWTKQRRAEERGRPRAYRQYIYSDRVNCTDVADSILPAAYDHASGGGMYTVSKRQLYYACREAFAERTERELEYGYFAGTLLVQYLNRHPEKTASWRITADPRGTLVIPKAGHPLRVPVGTVQIDNHLNHASRQCDPYDDAESEAMDTEWPSVAAGQRYQAVLYIEKEGFEPLLAEARIAEKFDLAIMSCKGQSVVAARRFVDEVCAATAGVPLFVVHDFDKPGFEIAERLTTVSDWAEDNDRVAYEFQNAINVTDLGLRLADVQSYDLASEACRFTGRFARDSIATEAEREFLRSGQRVELNAFTSPQFVEWLEGKLKKHLPKRLVPANSILESAYRRVLCMVAINQAIDSVREEAIEAAKNAKLPKSLRRQLAQRMSSESGAWDEVLYDLVANAPNPG